ncbi:MAG: lysylphosphatidylglycerol synthase transmembrane domain-containing protein [Actinomycetota bacterium]
MVAEPVAAPPERTRRAKKWIQGVVSAVLVVAVFAFALPKLADFSDVWREITEMTWLEIATIVLVGVWNIFTYWLVMMAALPRSNVWQVSKVNLATTAVSNTLPAGGALGVAATFGMFSSYGFSNSQISGYVLVSGIWNNFVKLGMPVIALALLAVQGDASGGLITAAVIGVGVLAAAVVMFVLTLRSDRLARRIGRGLGTAFSAFRKLVGKGPVTGWDAAASRFGRETGELVRGGWLRLTLVSLVSHLSLYFVLLLSLRHVGVSDQDVGWAQVLAAFAFIRLVSALPITPGGLGVVELGLSAALVEAGGPEAPVVAAVLLYRAITYVLPIPLGAVAYLKWRGGSEARRLRVEAQKQAVAAATAEPIAGRAEAPVGPPT